MDLPEEIARTCSKCEHDISLQSNFCANCGQAVNHKEISFYPDKKKNLKLIALFLAIELSFCVSGLIIENSTLGLTLFFDVAMASTAVWFFTADWRENKFLLKWPNFSVKKLIGLILVTITASVAVQFLVSRINEFIFNQSYTFYGMYAQYEYGKYIMVISIAVFPAIFEEIAYRGFLMQKLLKVVDPKEAIYITSILFFLVHFSIVSFFWMLPFAFLLGYVRLKTNTLWYGIAMHFFFNLVSCLIETYL